ncbi:hypothetical protein R3P38DRAFT_3547878 [Favolaschia claudopus]|uniref:Uncharacterized protein n=1 Tax=Favolaschia claudopus TaxID=2862362 RepID=A0AAW0E4M9_9AGAR
MPWAQIESCTHVNDKTTNPPYSSLNLLLLTPEIKNFVFRLDLRGCPPDERWNLDVSSQLERIDFEIIVDTVNAAGQLFDALELPSLKNFTFNPCIEMEQEPPMWHTERFLSLADRSDFSRHLTFLDIYAIITDTELLQCLCVLPMLQTLSISDFISIGANNSSPVITDMLLQALTYRTDAPSLIPHLEYVHLTSHLEFTDTAFIDFIKSRVKRVWESEDVTFEPILGWYWRPKGDMSGEILHRLHNLQEIIADWKGEILGHTEIRRAGNSD